MLSDKLRNLTYNRRVNCTQVSDQQPLLAPVSNTDLEPFGILNKIGVSSDLELHWR